MIITGECLKKLKEEKDFSADIILSDRAPDKEKINILVPFSGSGSELVACELTGVKYKGIEINPEYVKISEARLEKAKENPQSFLELFKDKKLKEQTTQKTEDLF